jgi:hypothetical protein
MGFIYILRNRCSQKVYIGQTTTSLERRWYEHQRDARKLARRRALGKKTPGIEQSHLYNAMVRYGIDNFWMESLEEAPDEKLDALETEYISRYDSIARGYNMTTGGGAFRHSPDTIALMKEVKKANVENYRHPKLEGMPAHVGYLSGKNGYEAVRIVNYPPYNGIFSNRKYGSFEAAKQAARKFLEQLEAAEAQKAASLAAETQEAPNAQQETLNAQQELPVSAEQDAPTDRPRNAKIRKIREFENQPQIEIANAIDEMRGLKINSKTGLPRGVIRKPNGYKVHKRINKVVYQKCFEDTKQTDESKKEAACAYLRALLATHGKWAVQRLNGSGLTPATKTVVHGDYLVAPAVLCEDAGELA